ncbi:hypothetical protein C3B44_11070 [Corynebacterium yudongzhengii]|nr:hypothetical protein C3B44_11070 [Corynebacterium yudongzhengii]
MIFQGLRRCLVRSLRSTAKSGLIALEVYLELLPGIRMTVMSAPTRRLPKNLGAGLLGAEAATWWAISPSLLPRPWWVTAANVACCQAVGHAAATGLAFGIRHSARVGDLHLPARLRRRTNRITHVAMAGITSVVFLTSLYRQDRQAALVSAPAGRGRRAAVRGSLVGTLGYGLLLLLAEASQSSVDRLNRELRRWLPPVVSWPLATLAFVGLITLASDRVLVRRFFNRAARSARRLNEAVVPEAAQPTEFERTGSARSHERWHLVGSQGRALLSSGPRARDIAEVTGAFRRLRTHPRLHRLRRGPHPRRGRRARHRRARAHRRVRALRDRDDDLRRHRLAQRLLRRRRRIPHRWRLRTRGHAVLLPAVGRVLPLGSRQPHRILHAAHPGHRRAPRPPRR